MICFTPQRCQSIKEENELMMGYENIHFQHFRKIEQNRMIQFCEIDNFDVLNHEFEHNKFWIEEGEKMLRKDKIFNDMRRMYTSKTENNVVIYWNDVYLNSIVKFYMKDVEQMGRCFCKGQQVLL
jgi:hypothetical protein